MLKTLSRYIYWDPAPELLPFNIPFLDRPILWYGFLFALGFFLAYVIALYLVRRFYGLTKKEAKTAIEKVSLYVVLGAVIGARLADVLFYQDWHIIIEHPLNIFKVWQGGLASHGGLLGILLALALFVKRYTLSDAKIGIWQTWRPEFGPGFSRRRSSACAGTGAMQAGPKAGMTGQPKPIFESRGVCKKVYPSLTWIRLLDLLSIPSAFAGACIRVGNFINQEILGKPTTVPWAIVFGHPADGSAPLPRHPVQLYEAVFCFILGLFLWFLWKKKSIYRKPGKTIGLFLVLLFSFRFVIEFFKVEQSNYLSEASPLTMGQYLSLPFIALGLYLFYRTAKNS